jgi:predicted phosphohydrolase
LHYFISDLHYGVNRKGDACVARLAERLRGEASAKDVLFLGSDLGTDDATVAACLGLFRSFPGRRFGILGNHDVWVEPGDTSLARHARLQKLLDEEGFHPLERRSAVVDGWGLVGAMGWYDYSFRDPIGVPDASYREKRDPDTGFVVWNDARFVRWEMSDEEATEWQVQTLRARLAELAGVERILALVHHVPHKDLLFHPRFLVPRRWRFANAFLGSNRLAEVLEADSRVREVVNGHIHTARSARHARVRYHSIGGDYVVKQILAFDGRCWVRSMVE